MKFVIVFVVTFYCLYHQVVGNQPPDDPNKPFWATRGRRSGRMALKADDDIPDKWADDDMMQDMYDKDVLLRKREQATSLLASILNALTAWDGEVIKKRGDGKTSDPSNPFWAARG